MKYLLIMCALAGCATSQQVPDWMHAQTTTTAHASDYILMNAGGFDNDVDE